MIIDFHSHNFPDALAPKALEVMCGKLKEMDSSLEPFGDGTVYTQLRDMDLACVDKCVNCPIATRPTQFDTILRRAIEMRAGGATKEAASRIFQLGSMHPADRACVDHARILKNCGIPGIAIHPNYQGVRLSDPRLAPFFAAVRDAGLFVICHSGFDPGFVDEPDVADPAAIAQLLTAVPGLKFVAAHLGGECGSPAHATDLLLPFETCWIDTAVMDFREDAEEAQRIVREWPADRMVFGTDYFWREQAHLIAWVKRLRPDPADQEKIFHLNAERLLKK